MSLKITPEASAFSQAMANAGVTGDINTLLTSKALITTLLYGVIFFLVAISFIFFYMHEFSRVKQGISTGIESVMKVFLTQIGLVFFLTMLFVILDILLPPEYKVSQAASMYFSGFGIADFNIQDPWLSAMKYFEGLTPMPKEKYYVAMTIYMTLMVLYIFEILIPFAIVGVTIAYYVKSYKDPMGSSTPLQNIAKAFVVYTLMVLMVLIHLKIGSAPIMHFTPYSYDVYSDMQKHLSIIFN